MIAVVPGRCFALAILVLLLLPSPSLVQTLSAPQLIADGAKALQERRFEAAFEAFSRASAQQPSNDQAWLGRGLAAFMMGRNDDAAASLERALRLDPRLLDASLVLGQLQYTGGRIADAIATYEAALKYVPGDERLANALTKWRAEDRLESRFYESRGAHFRVLFEGPSDDALARRVVEMLEQAYWSIGATLSTYPTQTIEVVLYTREQFSDVTRTPGWAAAAYDGRVRVPAKDALTRPGDLERVLVHELVHAFVATIGGRVVPTWLNEGLAVALEPGGIDASERVLAAVQGRIPLSDLHGGFGRLSGTSARIAYAESAVAARRLLDLRGAAAFVTLLQDLARGTEFDSAFFLRMSMTYADFAQIIARQ